MTAPSSASFILAAMLLAAPAVRAQGRRPITGNGTEGFRALVAGKGLQPLDSLDQVVSLIRREPERAIIISFRGADTNGRARPDLLGDLPFDLNEDFVDKGGALFVATDQPITANWNIAFHAGLPGPPVINVFASRAASAYREIAQCPFVAQPRVAGIVPDLFARTDVFRREFPGDNQGPLLVATNRPSYLLTSTELPTLGVFRGRDWSLQPFGLWFEPSLPFAQGKRYDGGGKFLLMADHSVFINSMLLPQNPNDNLAFASNCIDWLMIGPDGKRSYVLFIEDGKIWQREDYNLILQSLPQPRPDDIAKFLWENRDLIWQNGDLAEALLAQMEEDGIFDELERSEIFTNILDRLLEPWTITRIVLFLGAVGLFVYGIKAFIGSKNRFAKKALRLSMVLDRLRPRAGLLELRLRSGLGRGRYYELARQKARAMFADLRLTPAEDGALPAVTIDADWWRRARMLRDLRQIWAIAFGREPVAVTARQWNAWLKKLDQVELAIRNGVVRFS